MTYDEAVNKVIDLEELRMRLGYEVASAAQKPYAILALAAAIKELADKHAKQV